MPIEFHPVQPWLCFALALLAPPVALAVRRLGAHTRRYPLPPGWHLGHVLLTGATGLVVLVAILLCGPVLELATAHMLQGPIGRDLSEASTWAAGAASLYSTAARLAWQWLLLTWPMLYALARIAELRWPGRFVVPLATGACLPVAGAVVTSVFGTGATADPLVRALVLWGSPAVISLLISRAPRLVQRFRQWRQPPPADPTRISTVPAALAASLSVGEGPTTGIVRVERR